MYREKAAKFIIIIIALCFSGIFFSSCKKKIMNGMIVFTQVAEKVQNTNYTSGDSWRYIPKSRIVAIDPVNPKKSLMPVSADFYSAMSPEISFDGKFLLFAAQKKQGDIWQIWEMNLKNAKIRKVISAEENCTDPAYLPGGRLVFSKTIAKDSLKAGHSLFTGNLDGTDIKRITFNPYTYFASEVLKDGRVLTISKQVFPDQKDALLMAMRPDGTKSELFYQGIRGTKLFSRGYETKDGKIVFIESDRPNHQGGDVISISYSRPLHSRVNLTSEIQGDFESVFPLSSGNYLVSYRGSNSDRYELYEFDPVKKKLGQAIDSGTGYDDLEAVEVRMHERPKKLPSDVMTVVKTGLLMTQNINLHETLTNAGPYSILKASQVEIMGLDSLLGDFKPEEDGSFYLKVVADKPFQIRTLDKDGHIIKTCNWIWLRPNERRGCVGCHENQEQVPENRIALAVKKAPIKIPVYINKIVEKKVDTE